MKGTRDWLDVLEHLANMRIAFQAEWLWDGPDLATMRARVKAGPLEGHVALPGFVSDRKRVLTALQEADLLLFCHQTPESPRILIEALASGCPLLGYHSAFPEELIARHGGGDLTPAGNTEELAKAVAALSHDRRRLSDLMGRAARDGAEFDAASVFAHRAEIIRANLPRARRSSQG